MKIFERIRKFEILKLQIAKTQLSAEAGKWDFNNLVDSKFKIALDSSSRKFKLQFETIERTILLLN